MERRSLLQHDQLTSRWRHHSICEACTSKVLVYRSIIQADLKSLRSKISIGLIRASEISLLDPFLVQKQDFEGEHQQIWKRDFRDFAQLCAIKLSLLGLLAKIKV